MPKFEDHNCLLTREEDDVVTHFIDTGFFVILRRKFRSLCMISRDHPDTSRFFKSNAACRNEEIRHLLHHYNMIHPFSKFNLYWEFLMIFLLFSHYIMIPIDASILFMESDSTIYLLKFLLDFLYLMDIMKLFFTGYYDNNKSKVVLNTRNVAKRYLLSYFVFDLTSCIHSLLYPIIQGVDMDQERMLILRFLGRCKIVRLFRWLKAIELFRQYMGYSNYLFKGIKVVAIFIVITFWAFSINFFVNNYVTYYLNKKELAYWANNIFNNFYEATTMILLVNSGRFDLDYMVEYLNCIFFACFGFALQLFVYAQILQVWNKYASSENKHHSLQKQFKEFVTYKELPMNVRERIFAYFQFKFHKESFKESDINNMISPSIKQEILMHVTKNHIEKVEFFKHLPENVLVKVVAHLKAEIFLPGDVIISAGSTGNSMFFIHHGTVAVFTPTGKEICHLDDGAHFGEIALILSETRVATVIAVTMSELFMLRRADFFTAIEPFPECRDQLIELARERLNKTISRTDVVRRESKQSQ